MECDSARPLIEAYCDDELDVASAARLVAHLEECASCAREVKETEERTASVRLMRPVDTCPLALKESVLSCLIPEGPSRPPGRRALRVAVGVALGGVAAAAVVALALHSGEAPRHVPEALTGEVVVRELTGEVFCMRCALAKLFPGMRMVDAKHLPVLRMDDGEVVTILDNELAERKLAHPGCAGRRVTVTARYLPRQALAEVLEVFDEEPGAARPTSAEGRTRLSGEPPASVRRARVGTPAVIAAAPPAR